MNTENNYAETDLGNVSPNPRGEYSETGEYEYLDCVFYQGGSYLCLAQLGTVITGIAPEAGKTTGYWQAVALPGGLTPEYIAAHDRVTNLAEQVSAAAQEIREAKGDIESVGLNVEELQSQAARSAEEAEGSKDSAAGHAAAAETSRLAAAESEANVNALVSGFDTHVAEKTTEAEEDIASARQVAVGAIASQREESTQAVKDQTGAYIEEKKADALRAIEEKSGEYATSAQEDIQAVKTAGADQVTAVNNAGATQVKAVNAAGSAQVSGIEAAGATQKQAVDAAGATQTQAVTDAGTAQVEAIAQEGDAQVQNVQRAAAEIIADRDQIERNRQNLLKTAIIRKASGRSVTMDDSAETPFAGMKQFGWTKQDGTPTPENPIDLVSAGDKGNIEVGLFGANLFSPDPKFAVTARGVLCVVGNDGTVRVSGTPEAAYVHVYAQDVTNQLLTGVTYFISGGESNLAYIQMRLEWNDGTIDYKRGAFALTEAVVSARLIIQTGATLNALDYTFSPMLNIGSEALPWEPYAKQTLTHTTPNGLPGIPVSSDGNYTDETGQQWIADYRDWDRGVDVRMVKMETPKTTFSVSETADAPGRYRITGAFASLYKSAAYPCLTTHGAYSAWGLKPNTWSVSGTGFYFSPEKETTAEDLKEKILALINSDNPLKFVGQLDTPIETPIPAEELAAYRAVHTNKPYTTLVTDEGAYMEVEYAADTENYMTEVIENKVEGSKIITDTVTGNKYTLGMKNGLLTVWEVVD